MERKEFINKHWRYYLLLEDKFIQTFQFVEPNEENFKTFSNEFVLLIQSIGAELDLVFKQFCELDLDKRYTINNYYANVIQKFPDICDNDIGVKGLGFQIKPFYGWEKDAPSKSLQWWEAYNCIKHNRIMNQRDANFWNVLNILGALFLLEMRYIKFIADVKREPDIPDKNSTLFCIKGWEHCWHSAEGMFTVSVGEIRTKE